MTKTRLVRSALSGCLVLLVACHGPYRHTRAGDIGAARFIVYSIHYGDLALRKLGDAVGEKDGAASSRVTVDSVQIVLSREFAVFVMHNIDALKRIGHPPFYGDGLPFDSYIAVALNNSEQVVLFADDDYSRGYMTKESGDNYEVVFTRRGCDSLAVLARRAREQGSH